MSCYSSRKSLPSSLGCYSRIAPYLVDGICDVWGRYMEEKRNMMRRDRTNLFTLVSPTRWVPEYLELFITFLIYSYKKSQKFTNVPQRDTWRDSPPSLSWGLPHISCTERSMSLSNISSSTVDIHLSRPTMLCSLSRNTNQRTASWNSLGTLRALPPCHLPCSERKHLWPKFGFPWGELRERRCAGWSSLNGK